jgi:hypothetical protein
MTTLIRLIEQPKSKRSTISDTQREQKNHFSQKTHLIFRQRRRLGFDVSTLEPALK